MLYILLHDVCTVLLLYACMQIVANLNVDIVFCYKLTKTWMNWLLRHPHLLQSRCTLKRWMEQKCMP